jgi:hypothetical protein
MGRGCSLVGRWEGALQWTEDRNETWPLASNFQIDGSLGWRVFFWGQPGATSYSWRAELLLERLRPRRVLQAYVTFQ